MDSLLWVKKKNHYAKCRRCSSDNVNVECFHYVHRSTTVMQGDGSWFFTTGIANIGEIFALPTLIFSYFFPITTRQLRSASKAAFSFSDSSKAPFVHKPKMEPRPPFEFHFFLWSHEWRLLVLFYSPPHEIGFPEENILGCALDADSINGICTL